MADDSNVTITIAGNAAGLQTTLDEAIASFQRMRAEMGYVSDASATLGSSVAQSNQAWLQAATSANDYQDRLTYLKETLAATQEQQDANLVGLREATAALQDERAELQYTSEATRLLGTDTADANMSWLLAADGTAEYTARLSYLREQLALVRDQQNMMQESLGSVGGGGGLLGSFSALSGMLGGLGGLITGPLDAVTGFLGNAGSMFTALIGQQVFNAGYQGLQDFFVNGLFGLNKQTEQNVNSWRYTYGQGMNPTQATQNAQNISAWSQQFSMDIPFTRQSLMTAISGAAPLGLDLQGLQHYFPLFADLAATHINPSTGQPTDLGTVVQAIRGEEMGYSRMLKYDLNINTQDLMKYGLAGQGSGAGFKITDMSTLLPALEKYSEANGWTSYNSKGQDQGAAFETAHSTFWGEWSSFLDRIQNLELESGGGPFQALKDGLNFVSTWMDDHHDQLVHIADVFGNVLSQGIKDAGQAFGGFLKGLEQAGIGKAIMDDLSNAGKWLADPNNQQNIREFATALGQNLGNALSTLGTDFDKIATGLGRFKDSISPTELQALKDALGLLGSIIQTSVQVVAGLAMLLADYNLEMQAIGNGDVNGANHYRDRIGQDIQYIFGGSAPPADTYGQTPPVDPNSASSGSVSVDQNGKPTGTPTVNGPANGNTSGNPTAQSPTAESDLSSILSYLNVINDPHSSSGDVAVARQKLALMVPDMMKNGNPFAPTTDPALLKAQQQIIQDIAYINANPNNAAGDQQAYADLLKSLDAIWRSALNLGPAMNGGMHAALGGVGGPTRSGTSGGSTAYAQSQILVQTLHDGLGTSNGHQMGSDFVGNLATGMRTQLPIIATHSHNIGQTIGDNILKGVTEALGGGGAGGVGSLEGVIQQAIADAWKQQNNTIWASGHSPGGFTQWGTYGQR